MTHTPTPWEVLPGNTIAVKDSMQDVGNVFDEYDAEFIVRACNAHEELIETIRGLLTHPAVDKSKIAPSDLVRIHYLIAKAEAQS